jgi:thiol-disulfide isomerase/thioredoxin
MSRGLAGTARRAAAALLCALLWAAAPAAAATADPELLPVGSPAPLFEAVDTDGNAFSLAEALKERPVLLAFWSLFCATCRDELPILEQEQPKHRDKVQFVTVNLDEAPRAKTVKGFAKQQGFTMRMLLNKVEGREFNIDGVFKIKATPALYLVNRDGTVAYGHYGALSPEELAEVVAKAK